MSGAESPAESQGPDPTIVTLRVVTLVTAPINEALRLQAEIARRLGRLGGVGVDIQVLGAESPADVPEDPELLPIDEEERAFHALLGTRIVRALEEDGADAGQITRIDTCTQLAKIGTLRDALVLGADYMNDMRNLGGKSLDLIQQSLVRRFTQDEIVGWRNQVDRPPVAHIAQWCSRLDQMSGMYFGAAFAGLTVRQMLDMSVQELTRRIPQKRTYNHQTHDWDIEPDENRAADGLARAQSFAIEFTDIRRAMRQARAT